MDQNKIEVLIQIVKVREQVPLFSLRVMLDVVTLFIDFIPRVLKRDAVVLCIWKGSLFQIKIYLKGIPSVKMVARV